MTVSITHPKENKVLKHLSGVLVASGDADTNVTGVTATLTSKTDPTIRYSRKFTHLDRNKPNKVRWQIALAGDFAVGEYELTVTGHRKQQADAPVKRQFKVEQTLEKQDRVLSISIAYPDTNTISAEEAEALVATGMLGQGHSLIQASWGGKDADAVYDDGDYWMAMFPELTKSGTYALVVLDSGNHSVQKDITVV
ncbi:MAG: hypothetical protein U0736_10220 [Gemmataceae bacterium]